MTFREKPPAVKHLYVVMEFRGVSGTLELLLL